MDALSDKELVKHYRNGDNKAFTLLTRRHQDRLYRLACIYLYHEQDAMDVTQEVFMRAYKGLLRFRFQSEPFTWLYRTLRNVCSEYNRKFTRDKEVLHDADERMMQIEDNSNTETTQHLIEIKELIKQLPRRQYEVVMLRIFEGLTIEETACAMKCRPGTVKAMLNKAQKQIRVLNG